MQPRQKIVLTKTMTFIITHLSKAMAFKVASYRSKILTKQFTILNKPYLTNTSNHSKIIVSGSISTRATP